MKITEDPIDGDHVIIDASTAVIPAHVEVCVIVNGDTPMVGLELEGPRVGGDLANRSDELYVLDARTAALVCSYLIGMFAQAAERPGHEHLAIDFVGHLNTALEQLPGGRP